MGFDMKEYLRKNSNGKYIAEFVSEKEASEPHDAGWIEIPEGDTWAYKNSRGNIITMHGNVCQAFIGDLVWQRESMKDNSITKDYLEKQADGSYVMKSGFAFKDAGWIEIPDGAVKAYLNNSGTINFVNANDDYMNGVTHGEWVDTHRGKHESSGHQLVWQRESPNDKLASAEQYRQAEVLPFIDDEPENVDLASGCDLDELAKEYGFRDRDMGESCLSYRESLKIFTAIHKSREWDLSESDAWIESNIEQGSIEQTLAQRQSQYGCFEDVAFVTQGMIELMRKCNYDKMPAPHQMALSMICSKMARIVNGDFNHKDSWHDIGGYAKLIENEIFDDITEMPF